MCIEVVKRFTAKEPIRGFKILSRTGKDTYRSALAPDRRSPQKGRKAGTIKRYAKGRTTSSPMPQTAGIYVNTERPQKRRVNRANREVVVVVEIPKGARVYEGSNGTVCASKVKVLSETRAVA